MHPNVGPLSCKLAAGRDHDARDWLKRMLVARFVRLGTVYYRGRTRPFLVLPFQSMWFSDLSIAGADSVRGGKSQLSKSRTVIPSHGQPGGHNDHADERRRAAGPQHGITALALQVYSDWRERKLTGSGLAFWISARSRFHWPTCVWCHHTPLPLSSPSTIQFPRAHEQSWKSSRGWWAKFPSVN